MNPKPAIWSGENRWQQSRSRKLGRDDRSEVSSDVIPRKGGIDQLACVRDATPGEGSAGSARLGLLNNYYLDRSDCEELINCQARGQCQLPLPSVSESAVLVLSRDSSFHALPHASSVPAGICVTHHRHNSTVVGMCGRNRQNAMLMVLQSLGDFSTSLT
jgi:hypothetical protein